MEGFKITCLKCGKELTFKEWSNEKSGCSIGGDYGGEVGITCSCGNWQEQELGWNE